MNPSKKNLKATFKIRFVVAEAGLFLLFELNNFMIGEERIFLHFSLLFLSHPAINYIILNFSKPTFTRLEKTLKVYRNIKRHNVLIKISLMTHCRLNLYSLYIFYNY